MLVQYSRLLDREGSDFPVVSLIVKIKIMKSVGRGRAVLMALPLGSA
jgi:hypothetical protein